MKQSFFSLLLAGMVWVSCRDGMDTLSEQQNINSAVRLIIKASSNKVSKIDVSLESGVLYKGRWYGTKFRAIKE